MHAAAILAWPLPAQASVHGRALDRHMLLNLWIMLGLLAAAHALLLAGLLARPHPEPCTRERILRLEHLPLALLAILLGALAVRAHQLWAAERYTGPDPAALQVEATGMQFAWYFRYPGSDASFGATRPELIAPEAGNPLGLDPADERSRDDVVTGELVLPLGRPIDLALHAQDVIHGFAVPELRLKQNAVPGQTEHVHFTAAVPGSYAILCTQLCGLGHYRMQATLRVVPEPEFHTWLQAHERRSEVRP